MSVGCPVCGAASSEEADLPRDRLISLYRGIGNIAPQEEVLFEPYRLLRCSRCDLRFADPMRPGSPDFYDWAYRQSPYETDARWEWDEIVADLVNCPVGGVLDVGCGKGTLLKKIALATNRPVQGWERNEQGLAACARIRIPAEARDVSDLLAGRSDAGTYAAVVLSHVLEHLGDPLQVLKQAATLLLPSGRLYVAVPYSPQFWESDGYDPLNLPPHHLTRWHPRSFQALARGAGLNAVLRSAPPVDLFSIIWFAWERRFGMTGLWRRRRLLKVAAHPWQAARIALREWLRPREKLNGCTAGHILLGILSRP